MFLRLVLLVGVSCVAARLSRSANVEYRLQMLEKHLMDLEQPTGTETTDPTAKNEIHRSFHVHDEIAVHNEPNHAVDRLDHLACSATEAFERSGAEEASTKLKVVTEDEDESDTPSEPSNNQADMDEDSEEEIRDGRLITVDVGTIPHIVQTGLCNKLEMTAAYLHLILSSEAGDFLFPVDRSLRDFPPARMFAPGSCFSPFHEMGDDDLDMFKWIMWAGTQYGWHANPYTPLDSGKKGTRTPVDGMPTVRHVAAKRKRGQVAGAQYAMITPGDFNDPFVWLCRKLETAEFCGGAMIRLMTFRGMRLIFRMTTPPLSDLVVMRGMTKIADCKFDITVGDQKIDIDIPHVTEGSCLLTKALAQAGMFGDILDQIAIARNSGKKLFLVLSGLSFGGAIAQVALAAIYTVLTQLFTGGDDSPELSSVAHIHMLLFSSPRVGDTSFAEYLYQFPATINQFIIETYPRHKPRYSSTSVPVRLAYDPVAMWPSQLHPVGNLHSIRYYFASGQATTTSTWRGSEERLVHTVEHNLRYDDAAPQYNVGIFVPYGSRFESPKRAIGSVAPLDRESFDCLHVFNLLLAWAEKRPSTGWCKPFGVPGVSLPKNPPRDCVDEHGIRIGTDADEKPKAPLVQNWLEDVD